MPSLTGGGFIMPISDTRGYKLTQKIIELTSQPNLIFQRVLDNSFIKELVIELQTTEQLGKEHVDSEGEDLFNTLTGRTTYSLFDEQGRGGQQYKLFDTGAFWESTEVEVTQTEIVIKMNPVKDDDNLFEIYGANVEGLTTENIEILTREALKLHIQFFRQELGI